MKRSNRLVISLLAIAAAGLLATGCASNATRLPRSAAMSYMPSVDTPLASVSVKVTPEVQEKLKKNFKFQEEDLQQILETALKTNGLLNPEIGDSAPELHVSVTKVRIRSTINAVMWGAMAGNDSLGGVVTVRDESGRVLDELKVSASYALGGWGGGQDAMRVNWLYEAFAKEVVKAYTEVKTKP